MKNLFILVLVLFTINIQAQVPLCVSPATESFAALASNDNFVRNHLNPLPYQHEEPKGQIIVFDTPEDEQGRAYFIDSDQGNDSYIIVFHEWWGLNEHIKRQVDQLSEDLPNKHIMALDLYDGKVATTREEAMKFMRDAEDERIRNIIEGAFDHAGTNAEFGTIGWCYGGGWALQAGIMAGKAGQVVVMYYGMPEKNVSNLENLHADVLGIFAKKDQHITEQVVENFKVAMAEANKNLRVEWFDADHAFANPSNPSFDESASEEAYNMAIAFLKQHLD